MKKRTIWGVFLAFLLILTFTACGLFYNENPDSITAFYEFLIDNISYVNHLDASGNITSVSTANVVVTNYSNATYNISNAVKVGNEISTATVYTIYQSNSSGVSYIGSIMPANAIVSEQAYINNPPQTIFEFPLEKGKTWSYDGTALQSYYSNGSLISTATITTTSNSTVDSFVDITVPAGKFRCAKIITLYSNGRSVQYVAREGTIKSERLDASGNVLLSTELKRKSW